MQHCEIISRAVWYLHQRKCWTLTMIRDYTDIPVKDIPQLVNEGRALVLNDVSKAQLQRLCGTRIKA